MVRPSESAYFFTSEPFGGGSFQSLWPHSCQQKPYKQHSSSNKTKSLNEVIFLQVDLIFGERSVDDMTEIRLQTDMQEAQDGENLVDDRITDGGVDIGRDEEILKELEKFHGEEEENTRGELSIGGARVDPIRREETHRREHC